MVRSLAYYYGWLNIHLRGPSCREIGDRTSQLPTTLQHHIPARIRPQNYMNTTTQTHNLPRHTAQANCFILRHSTIGDRAFPVTASRVWNSLPSSVTSSTLLSAFRRRLKTELFSRCFGLDSVWNCCSTFYSDCVLLLFYCKVFLQF